MHALRGYLAALMAATILAGPVVAQAADGAPRLLVDMRTRFEAFDTGASDAEALTTRVRLGVETPVRAGVSGLIEWEAVGALVDDYADGVRARPWDAVIPDPEIFELNRAQVAWAPSRSFSAVLGRQRLVLNNGRFVGPSGWRQNEQTFDAAKLVWSPSPPLHLTYVYVDNVRRTTGRDHPQGVFRSDSHLVQGDLALAKSAKLSAYAYLLDFTNAPGQSSATTGVRLAGKRPVAHGVTADWELEYARQTDFADNPADFRVDYGFAAAGLSGANWSAGLVVEQLGGSGGNSFQTPIATLHPFQGWSDVIGATPATGLRDVYLRGARTLATKPPVKLSGEIHDFRDDTGAKRFGREADAAVSVQVSKAVSVEAGLARFETDIAAYPDATRTWISLEFRR